MSKSIKGTVFGSVLLVLILSVVLTVFRPPAAQSAPAAKPSTGAKASPGQARDQSLQDLYAAAKAEGDIRLQTPSIDPTTFQPVIDAFQKKYPGITVSSFVMGPPSNVTRVLGESAAGKVTIDVMWTPSIYILPLIDRDLLVSYDWQKTSDVDPPNIILDGRYVHIYDTVPVWAFNTKLVSKADAPKTFQDLFDPKWRGKKILVPASAQFAFSLIRQWQQDKHGVLPLLTQFQKQDPHIVANPTDTVQRLGNGEAPIAWTNCEQYQIALGKGAPLALSPIGPSYYPATGMCIPKNSPHPNAAKLLVSWLASQEASQYWLHTAYTRWNQGHQAKVLSDAGIKFSTLNTIKDLKDVNDLMAAAVKALNLAK